MSEPDRAGLRALAFGTADGGLWGAAFARGGRVLVAGFGAAELGAEVEWTVAQDGSWRLAGEGAELTVSAAAAPAAAHDAIAPNGTSAAVPGAGPELCRVHGLLGAGGGRETDAIGVRASLPEPRSAKDAPASARFVGAWFPDGSALGVLAARPQRAAHQDGDAIAANLFDADAWTPVADPRLSTTYDEDGIPRRVNLELWVGEGESEYPRRAAGEAAGPGGESAAEGAVLRAVPLSCHSRDVHGAGVYALARF